MLRALNRYGSGWFPLTAPLCREAAQAESSFHTYWGSGINESNTVCRNMYARLKLTFLTAKYA